MACRTLLSRFACIDHSTTRVAAADACIFFALDALHHSGNEACTNHRYVTVGVVATVPPFADRVKADV